MMIPERQKSSLPGKRMQGVRSTGPRAKKRKGKNMGCFCNVFENNEWIWILILLLILFCSCCN